MSRASDALYSAIGSLDTAKFSGKIYIIRSLWNQAITQYLLDTCEEELIAQGISPAQIEVMEVPGSYELVYGAMKAIEEHKAVATICLGCIIKGETQHDEFIANAIAIGLQNLMLQSKKPCILGVLTTNNEQQAIDRSNGTHGNKGKDSAITALQLLSLNTSS